MNLVNAHQQKKNTNNICGIRLADFRCCAIKSVKRGLFFTSKGVCDLYYTVLQHFRA